MIRACFLWKNFQSYVIIKTKGLTRNMNELSDFSNVEISLLKHACANGIPINGSLELLPLCNMDCPMCYVHLDRKAMEQAGRLRTVDEWLMLAGQMSSAGVLFLLLTGGEPLLYPDFQTLYLKLKKLGMILTINTNGTLIDKTWAQFFGQHKPRRVNISLYGSDNQKYHMLCHYSDGYDRVISAIHLLRENNVDVKINYSAIEANKQDVDNILAICSSLHVPIHIDSYMYPATRERNIDYPVALRLSPKDAAEIWHKSLKAEMGESQYLLYRDSLLNQVEKRRNHIGDMAGNRMTCMAGNCSFTINWQGLMRPCVMLDAPSVPVFGNSFLECWKQLKQETAHISLCDDCIACEYRPLCHICAASALHESGCYQGKSTYLCDLAAESYRRLKGESQND